MALVLNYIVGKSLRRMLKRSASRPDHRRSRTALSITASFFGYLTLTVALVLCLRVLGVNYQAILAGAGVAGIALGFGAQTLVRICCPGSFSCLKTSSASGTTS